MTQEEKELLLKDLSARLPYGVQIHIDFNGNGHIVGDATLNTITSITGQFFNFTDFEQDFKNGDCCPISGFGSNKHLHLEEFKPYLRPLSSMTEVEREHLQTLHNIISDENYGDGFSPTAWEAILDFNNYCHEHHLDNGGLITIGLAIEAPEGMYNTKIK